MADIIGQALLDFYQGRYTEDILTYSSLDEQDSIPLPYFFRNYKDMPPLEQKALQLCKGDILDIGCGAGSHSLHLQEKGLKVTALDRSPGAVETCSLRGLKHIVQTDIMEYGQGNFDTLLLLMNGIGIAGKLKNLDGLFTHLKTLLNPKGQILLDSSDIIYMFDEDEDGGYWIPEHKEYYGEVDFTMEYKGVKGDTFPWLYLDYNTLQRAAHANDLNCELVMEGEHYDFLARLTSN